MKVLTAQQMQQVDQQTIREVGIPGVVLMENAGRQVAERIMAHYPDRLARGTLVVAGRGNNGGDGYVIARHLLNRGWPVQVLLLAADRHQIQGDAAIQLKAFEQCGGQLLLCDKSEVFTGELLADCGRGVLVDALFGTGLSKSIGGLYAEAIAWMNQRSEPVVAVDIPSGINASTGQILGCCVEADLTVTFAFAKVGLVSYPGAGHVGELQVVDIGIPPRVGDAVLAETWLVDAAEAASLLPDRPADGHKGSFGHLLVVAGSRGKSGAAAMAAESALRGGAGLVTLACPAAIQAVVAGQLFEVMTVPLPDQGGELSHQALPQLLDLEAGKQALALGPGLGLGEECLSTVRRLIEVCRLPMVIDADALTALAGRMDLLQHRIGQHTVLTPHPGEMARLTGLSVAEIQSNRVTVAREFAVQHGLTLILKGARTLTATATGQVFVNQSGHAGLASGGMGDVLTGLVGSLLAQGLPAATAAPLAVYLHGAAAERLRPVFGDAGLLATDLMRELPATRMNLKEKS